ncbi:hypothetical protein I203_103430 [Kwoniella mangroviensis CBS 8507]|uniref:mitochondrial 37S ribosomal protein uS11m n=1 Tax=Kwoniella mangroviensis CBS 8507 TaxID=1296122 RepID=UPI00080D5F65|nr:uncharacterized protein I203_06134 [Kwoniella mangroviensis CBS 8507]OCF64889.1 hypothetical protein I203_06134 [Kwoniella mangroviensis CBS 8507]
MASLIRSTIFSTSSRLSRPTFIPTASFASSSRHGLDFTRPRQFPPSTPTTTTTTTLLEEDPTTEPITESHESPSTSNQNAEPIPTSQPSPTSSTKTIPTPTSTPTSTPIPSSPARARSSKGSGLRWLAETDKSNDNNKHLVPTHTLHVRSTRNNIVLSFTDGLGPVFTNVSGGSDRQFKNSQRSSYEAATQASIKMFEKILEYHQTTTPSNRRLQLRVSFNGLFGMGREAIASALSGPEGQEIRSLITRVEDRTKIKIGGTRARKPRRL